MPAQDSASSAQQNINLENTTVSDNITQNITTDEKALAQLGIQRSKHQKQIFLFSLSTS